MTIWKDAQGNLHDDMNGEALTLPGWPSGLMKIANTEAAALQNPSPTIAQLQSKFENEIQFLIDKTANKKGYDSGVSCASYANSTNTTFRTESTAFIAWRDSVWSACYSNAQNVTAATKWSDVLAILPAAPW